MCGLAGASHYLLERPVLDLNRRFGALQRPHPRLFARRGARPVEPRPNGRGPFLRLAAGLVGLGVAVGLAFVRFGGPPLPGLQLSPLPPAPDPAADAQYPPALPPYRDA